MKFFRIVLTVGMVLGAAEPAKASSAGEDRCESTANVKWLNNGQYDVKMKSLPVGRFTDTDRQSFPAYSTNPPIKGRELDFWNSKFSSTSGVPKDRSEFFARGTMYRFEFNNMTDSLQDPKDNWRLLNAKIAGANSNVKIYRIDNNESSRAEECPKDNKGQLVGEIPFFFCEYKRESHKPNAQVLF